MGGYKKFMTVIASKSWDPRIYWLFYRQSNNTGEGKSNCPVDTAGFVFILTETWHKYFTFLLSNPCLLVIISFHQHHSFCLSFLSVPPQNRMVVIIFKLSRNIFKCGFSPVMDIASKHKAIRDTL